MDAPVVPLVLPAPVPDVTGPLLMVPPLVVLPVVPEVELPVVEPSGAPLAAPLSAVIESCSVLEVPLMSELPLASESVAMSPEPVLGSLELLPPLQALNDKDAPSRAMARKLMRGLYMIRTQEVRKRH